MTKIEKAAEQATKILGENKVHYVLTYQTEDGCTSVDMCGNGFETLESIRGIVRGFISSIVEDGVPKEEVLHDIIDAVMMGADEAVGEVKKGESN